MSANAIGVLGRVRRVSSAAWPVEWSDARGPDVRTLCDAAERTRVTVAGAPCAPGVDPAEIPARLADTLAADAPDPADLRRIRGYWAVVFEDRMSGVVRFASDPLGVYPLFLAETDDGPAFASDVWQLHGSNYGRWDAVDAVALANWLLFAADFSGGSLLRGVRRLPGGRIVTLRDGQMSETSYADFARSRDDARPITAEEAAERLHDLTKSHVLSALPAGRPRVALGLSGGYDSRLLAAIAHGIDRLDLLAWTAEWDSAEAEAAEGAARALGLDRLRIPIDGSLYDFYEFRDQSTPAGFPYLAFILTEAVRRFVGGRQHIHGFLGGVILGGRGGWPDSFDTAARSLEEQARDLVAEHEMEGAYVLRPEIRRAVRRAGLDQLERLASSAPAGADLRLLANFRLRQPNYIAPSFLSYLDVAPTLLPYYSHEFLDIRFRYDLTPHADRIYPLIFQRYYPALSNLPVDRELRREQLTQRWNRSRYLRRRAASLVPGFLGRRHPAVGNARALPRLLARAVGRPTAANWVSLLDRLDRLERRLRDRGLAIDWEEVAALGG